MTVPPSRGAIGGRRPKRDGWMTSMATMLAVRAQPVDGRTGVTRGGRSDHVPHQTAPVRRVFPDLVVGMQRASSAYSARTPVPLPATGAKTHPREQDAPCRSPARSRDARTRKRSLARTGRRDPGGGRAAAVDPRPGMGGEPDATVRPVGAPAPRDDRDDHRALGRVPGQRRLPGRVGPVQIGGLTKTMTKGGGTDWEQRVTFHWSGKLPAGIHRVTFEATQPGRQLRHGRSGSITIAGLPTPPPDTDPDTHADPDRQAHAEADAQADATPHAAVPPPRPRAGRHPARPRSRRPGRDPRPRQPRPRPPSTSPSAHRRRPVTLAVRVADRQ